MFRDNLYQSQKENIFFGVKMVLCIVDTLLHIYNWITQTNTKSNTFSLTENKHIYIYIYTHYIIYYIILSFLFFDPLYKKNRVTNKLGPQLTSYSLKKIHQKLSKMQKDMIVLLSWALFLLLLEQVPILCLVIDHYTLPNQLS